MGRALIYASAGLISGIVSGASAELKPLGLILPGLIFGASLVFASKVAKQSLAHPLNVVGCSVAAYIAADIAFLTSLSFVDDVPWGRVLCGAFCGLAGASTLAIFFVVALDGFDLVGSVLVSAVGCLRGAILMPITIRLHDTGAIGSSFWSFLLLLCVWQTVVMLTIAHCRRPKANRACESESV